MATAILSIACRQAGLEPLSVALLWLAVLAFAPLALLDVGRARHPLALLHRAGDPGLGFPAFGFVADACVLGARLVGAGPIARLVSMCMLGCGAVVWLVIAGALARARAGGSIRGARGEWLLAVVATEGLAILAGKLASPGEGTLLRDAAVGTWALGIAGYLVGVGVLTRRLATDPLSPAELTPDWWIVMGSAAIVAVAGTSVRSVVGSDAGRLVVLVAWAVATVWVAVLAAGEIWQAARWRLPRFTPARWSMVFPLGMYSTAGQLAGRTLGAGWIVDLGRGWLVIALAAWLSVAAAETHHAFTRPAES